MKVSPRIRRLLADLAAIAPAASSGPAEGGDPDHEGGLISAAVLQVEYIHEDDPDDTARFHEFDNEVPTLMYALPGGIGVLIVKSDGSPLVADFEP